WIDGGHNPSAGHAMARFWKDQPMHLIVGMLANKDPKAIIDPLAKSSASVTAVPVPGHDHHGAAAFGENVQSASDLPQALAGLPGDLVTVFITGSLYLVGEALRLNDEVPD
ncbi:MAG: bifunctional folylpolyglutamate synthase/dihydrofolate synthase, partial [Pseudomonadota bacterium]